MAESQTEWLDFLNSGGGAQQRLSTVLRIANVEIVLLYCWLFVVVIL
jgi:hypothetical protein